MERNAVAASGSSNIVKNFYGPLSSNVKFDVCKNCGSLSVIYNKTTKQHMCKTCGPI